MKLLKCFVKISILLIAGFGLYYFVCTYYYNTGHNSVSTPSFDRIRIDNPYYSQWEISFKNGCSELFFVESDHIAFGEGFRYSVLFPSDSVFVNRNASMSRIMKTAKAETTKTTGCGYDRDANSFLRAIWERLEVPKEYRCDLMGEDLSWVKLSKNDGSRVFIIVSIEENRAYIAEVLY